MTIAQSLYEGVDLGKEGAEGLITYMRTDSVRIAPEAIEEARKFISKKYGKELLHPTVRTFATKKECQDANEAIRPTNLAHPPEKVKAYLSRDQYLLMSLSGNGLSPLKWPRPFMIHFCRHRNRSGHCSSCNRIDSQVQRIPYSL